MNTVSSSTCSSLLEKLEKYRTKMMQSTKELSSKKQVNEIQLFSLKQRQAGYDRGHKYKFRSNTERAQDGSCKFSSNAKTHRPQSEQTANSNLSINHKLWDVQESSMETSPQSLSVTYPMHSLLPLSETSLGQTRAIVWQTDTNS